MWDFRSFFSKSYRVCKISWKKSKEPLENANAICGLLVAILAVGVLLFKNKESGDYMTLWALAIPLLVLGVFFIFNVVKIHHKFRKDRTPGIIVSLLIISASFAVLLFVKVAQNLEPKKEVSIPDRAETESNRTSITIAPPKLLPDKIISTNEFMPVLVSVQPSNAPVEVEAVKTNSFEGFDPDYASDGGTNNIISTVENFKKRKAQLLAKKAAEKATEEAAEALATQKDRQKWWNVYLPFYQHALAVLHDTLIKHAAESSDGVSQSEGYFQCLTTNLDTNIGEFKPAEIRLQKNTNIDFYIIVNANNTSNHRQLRICCDAGYLEMEGIWGQNFYCDINVNPDYEEKTETNYDNANKLISASINDLVDAQYYYSLNKSVTNKFDKPK